jgi:small-conductance mechanosensitive channel
MTRRILNVLHIRNFLCLVFILAVLPAVHASDSSIPLKQDQPEAVQGGPLDTEKVDGATEQPTLRTGEGVSVYFSKGVSLISNTRKKIYAFITGPHSHSAGWKNAFSNLNAGKGSGHLLLTILVTILLMAIGTLAERIVKRTTQNVRCQILERAHNGNAGFFSRIISNLVLNLLGFAAYLLTTFLLCALFFEESDPSYLILSAVLLASYYIKAFILAADLGLSPKEPALRIFPLQDEDAAFLGRWTNRLVIAGIGFATFAYIFKYAGLKSELFYMLYGFSGIVVNFLLILMIWNSRKRVAKLIWAADAVAPESHQPVREKLAKSWHILAILYTILIGSYWFANAMDGRGAILELLVTLFLIPLFIGIDQWVQKLLKIAVGELPEVIDLSGDPEDNPPDTAIKNEEIKCFVPLISTGFRVVLVISFLFAVLKLWGLDLPVGRLLTRTAFSTVGALLFGYIGWQYIRTVIDRKLKEEMPDGLEDMEEGGAGGSRTATLLLLLRKFVLAVMIVMISLIVLSSLGINIAPLIAGAGVIGLAIGFGAQTLVKDIISGIFFLIDDAFRVGDYIETAGTKGMVEHISLRSLRLRHPRGPVFTIPFGGMGTVKNNSRDYIIEKLDFRVRYNTDVDKVRKVIKKINKTIQRDENLGPVLLDKIKSQGVRELDDSAMIMRVKFKTIPGEQFIVRREVFRMIQEAFRENGIEFAHRNVTVYLPSQAAGSKKTKEGDRSSEENPGPGQAPAEVAGAAALAVTHTETNQNNPLK